MTNDLSGFTMSPEEAYAGSKRDSENLVVQYTRWIQHALTYHDEARHAADHQRHAENLWASSQYL